MRRSSMRRSVWSRNPQSSRSAPGRPRRGTKVIPAYECPKAPLRCSGGIARRQMPVQPEDVEMTEAQLKAVRLHAGGELYHCLHCGCVWEQFRDDLRVCHKRVLGTFDGPGPEVGFILNPRFSQRTEVNAS